MAKKRKTRQQKITTTLRHIENPITYSLSSLENPGVVRNKPMNTARTTRAYQESTYHFVAHDLLRTSFITGAIILAELVLFFVLR